MRWYRDYGLEPETLSNEAALSRLLPSTKGAYLIGAQDPDLEIPLAVTLSGLHDRVLVAPAQVDPVRRLWR